MIRASLHALLLVLPLLLTAPGSAAAFGLDSKAPRWEPGKPIAFVLNLAQAPGTLSREQVVATIEHAFTPWVQIDTADLSFTLADVINDPAKTSPKADGVNMIFWELGSKPRGDMFAGKAYTFATDCDILLQPRAPYTLIDLQATLVHELGHCLGLKHSAAEGVMKKFQGAPAIGHDDRVAVSLRYPNAARPLSRVTATVKGRVTQSGHPLTGAVLRVIDGRSRRVIVAGFSGLVDHQRRPDASGRFELPGLPPGQHEFVIEPMDAFAAADPKGYGAPIAKAPAAFPPVTRRLPALEAGRTHDVGTIDVASP